MRLLLYGILATILFLFVYILLFGRDKANKLVNRIFMIGIIVASFYFVIFMMSI